jgi:predicted metal-dependent peptidase
MTETWGDRSTLERTIQYVIKSVAQWGVLNPGSEKGSLVATHNLIRISERLRSTAQCRLHVVQCDTRITQVNTYESWETPDSLKPENFRGHGGTDFRPVFDWIREKVLPVKGWPDLLAYLTDTQGPFPDNLPAYPVVWLPPQTARVIWYEDRDSFSLNHPLTAWQ